MGNPQQLAELLWGTALYLTMGAVLYITYVLIRKLIHTTADIIRAYYRLWFK